MSELPEKVYAGPVKAFFVQMLTRDIAVEDAILDLLDNCVDGVLRTLSTKMNQSSLKARLEKSKPYEGYWAKVTVSANGFKIEDNCGGIPASQLERAFRMGRPQASGGAMQEVDKNTVGVYGIGMKRAIFKIGTEATVTTHNGSDSYRVPISSEWMHTEGQWDLPVESLTDSPANVGTVVSISELNGDIAERFSSPAFLTDLRNKVRSHYAVILEKGFAVEINGVPAKPVPIKIHFAPDSADGREVRPYLFSGKFPGKNGEVDVTVVVGLRQPIPGIETVLEGQQANNFSTDYAGWTVICNDRVVLYCNRDELTGWGTPGIPRYHTQFIAISGVVEFEGNAADLPTNTTKRGLDFSSSIYQQTLVRMNEGLTLFTTFTNRWKAREDEARTKVTDVPSVTYSQVKSQIDIMPLSAVHSGYPGKQFKPKLPVPARETSTVRISYQRDKDDMQQLGEHLIDNFDELRERDRARNVGEASFEYAYKNLIGRA